MRQFTLKPKYDAIQGLTGGNISISYKEMLIGLISTKTQLSSEQFFRATDLFSKIKNANEGDTLDIEDQDYEMLKAKIDPYIQTLVGPAVTVPDVAVFIKEVIEMPKK